MGDPHRLAPRVSWARFVAEAPRVSEIFARRHAACGNLCFLGTLRADGSPRISPLEPRVFEDRLVLVGMTGSAKFADLARDPRFTLHTATVDPRVGEGDAKLSGVVQRCGDEAFRRRFADHLRSTSGMELAEEDLDPFLEAEVHSASSVEVRGDHLAITVWRAGEPERVVRRD